MKKTITVIEQDADKIEQLLEQGIETDVVFEIIQKDTIGRSNASPTWGYVYYAVDGKLQDKGVGLYKENDYDYPDAAYAEKICSILGKNILHNVRVPEIDIVEQGKNNLGLISYRILDGDKEDLIHIRDLLYHKYERHEMKERNDLYTIDDILDCIRIQVERKNPENYKELEKAVIHTIMLDCITNNADRHPDNWALIRNKKTNKYELGIYDHSTTLVDMIDYRKFLASDGWASSFLLINETSKPKWAGDSGNKLLRYIFDNYKEYFDEFYTSLEDNMEKAITEISEENLGINKQRVISKLKDKKRFLRKLYIEKGELEYDD